jgi:hypothetical protein
MIYIVYCILYIGVGMVREILGRYCSNCKYTYFSRARHDFRSCPCWVSSSRKTGGYVDGGRDYFKVGGSGVLVRLEISQTDEELKNDYILEKNKYGLIKGNVGRFLDKER